MSRLLCVCVLMSLVMGWSGCGSNSVTLGQPDNSGPPPPVIAKPAITSITPSSVGAGGPDLAITVDGTNYKAPASTLSCWVVWTVNQTQNFLLTDFVSTTELTATVPAALMTAPGMAQVQVECGDEQGAWDGVNYPISAAVQFAVTP